MKFNPDGFERVNKDIPKNKWKVEPNQKFGFFIVMNPPYWLFPIGKRNYITQFADCKCICGKERPVKCSYLLREANEFFSCGCKHALKHKTKGSYAKDGYKICYTCNNNLTIDKFSFNNQSYDKLNRNCNTCQYLKSACSRYKISIQDLIQLIEESKLLCGICTKQLVLPNNRNNKEDTICIDHNHITNKVRGILCQDCNRAIGIFQDDTNRLNNAVKYLNKYSI